MKTPLVLFIFRRDLRLEDHKPLQDALDYASDNNAVVVPMFIFNKAQVGTRAPLHSDRRLGKSSPVRSYRSIACLIQSLKELDTELHKKYRSKLSVSYASDDIEVLKSISKIHEIYAIFETKDYTPFANERSKKIQKFCDSEEIEYQLIEYLYLVNPDEMKEKLGKIYQKFTPFYNAVSKLKIPTPTGYVKGKFSSFELGNSDLRSIEKEIFGVKTSENRVFTGGRKEGLKFLKNLKSIKNYEKIRNQLPLSTSNLSVHHHYGTVSIRESYYASQKLINSGAKELKEFQRQLFWRDFYGALCANFGKFYKKDLLDLVKQRPKLTLKKKELFKDWCDGTTGIDVVDAGMKQLNESGFMANRSRLLCASLLTKSEGWKIPWQYGAGYFAEKLLDYDFTQNTMNWLFVSGGYPFSEPPFRRVNPDRQAKLLDPDGIYRKKWLKL